MNEFGVYRREGVRVSDSGGPGVSWPEDRGNWISAPLRRALLLIALLIAGCAPSELTWHEEPGYRWADLRVNRGETGFDMLRAAKTGITFINRLSDDQIVENRHRMHGSGVALGDVDGDGWTDIYLARLDGNNALYRNLGGWKFEDVSAVAGVQAPDRFSTGAVLADVDGDGDLDLLVTAMGGPNAAFLNDGTGRFVEATEALGLGSSRGSTTMALADVEGDGDLDLYVANYKRIALRDSLSPRQNSWGYVVQRVGDDYRINPELEDHYVLEKRENRLIKLELAESDRFYLNDGRGGFTEALSTGNTFVDEAGNGLQDTPGDWALAARFQDLNGDGAPDLYVCNDFEGADRIWLNDGLGRFRPMAPLAIRKTSNATMSVAFSDVERDGRVDVFMADMFSRDYSMRQRQRGTQIPLPATIGAIDDRPQVMRNTLLNNRGDGTYAEIAGMMGVQASDWTWSSVFLDVDLDGYEDLLLTNGHAFDVQDLDAQDVERYKAARTNDADEMRRLLLEFPPLSLKNAAFKNEAGTSFAPQPDGWGFGAEADVSHGMALGDLDNDGDLDVVVNRLNVLAGVYENTGDASRVAVRLRGALGNTQGVGAKIRLLGGPVPVQEKEVTSGGLYLSGSDPMVSLATGGASEDLTLEVTWRSGAVSRIRGIVPDRLYEIKEESGLKEPNERIQEVSPLLFEEVSLDHVHREAAFDDFARQPLLPRRFSQMGPAVAWADVDRDGDDDLIVGTGRGGSLSLFRNDDGSLSPQGVGPAGETADLDQAGILAVPTSAGVNVFVASTNYEAERGASSRIDVFSVEGSRWRLEQQLEAGLPGIGPLAASDIDGDGDLDLFVGGALVPGRYPEPASSRLFILGASYESDDALNAPFDDLGMVHGAVFGDIDGDNDQDLALALEWGGLKLFLNDGSGHFSDVSVEWGLGEATGVWQGVETGDFDGDGRLDLIATNWGWNSLFGRPAHPLRLYWGDYDGNGTLDVLESHFESSMNGYVPEVELNLLSYSIPSVRRHILTFKSFSEMTIDRVIGPGFENGGYVEAHRLAHRVYLHRGDRFEGADLPLLAQVAPGFGVAVGDFDADGLEDAFIAQNFFAERLEVPRSDAGRGLWIRGIGGGAFELAEGTTTGVKVYGEQRGVGLSDYDRDGRLDLAVSQNGNALKLYRNATTVPGIRVRLEGPSGNAWGVGSRIRAIYDDGSMGPTRNVAAGSGYLSQRSAVQVLGAPVGKRAVGVRVNWPDGSVQEAEVDGDEVLVRWEAM